jgi:hypothetical protein
VAAVLMLGKNKTSSGSTPWVARQAIPVAVDGLKVVAGAVAGIVPEKVLKVAG